MKEKIEEEKNRIAELCTINKNKNSLKSVNFFH